MFMLGGMTSVGEAPLGPPNPVVPLSGLHARVLDRIGLAICSGDPAAGSLLYIDDLAERYAVSRSVVREALRVLSSMGMVASRRRVGTLILAPSEWNLFDPQVIRWRMATQGRKEQLRSLTELRAAVSPRPPCTPRSAPLLRRPAGWSAWRRRCGPPARAATRRSSSGSTSSSTTWSCRARATTCC